MIPAPKLFRRRATRQSWPQIYSFGTHKKLYTSFVGLDTPQFGRGSWLLEPLKGKKRL